MSLRAGLLTCGACLVLGIAIGVGSALTRPDSLRRLAKTLGFQDANKRWFYNQTVAFHQRVDACIPDQAVIFIGDSFIQGLCVTEVEFGGINFGIGGDTTEGVLARLPRYTSVARARGVVFAVGDNDLRKGRTEVDIVANYRKILAQVPEKVPVFFCSLTPCNEDPDRAPINRGIATLNSTIKELCGTRPACHFVDLSAALSDDRGFLRSQFDGGDGVHLNGAGYRLCIEKLREALAQRPAELAK